MSSYSTSRSDSSKSWGLDNALDVVAEDRYLREAFAFCSVAEPRRTEARYAEYWELPLKAEILANTGVAVELWSPQEVSEALNRHEIVLIDVRTPVEFAFEHIKGALLYPMWGFEAKQLPGQETKPLVFHCGTGIRSGKILARCAEHGMTKLAHMEGGFGAWKAAGLKYVATDPATGTWTLKP